MKLTRIAGTLLVLLGPAGVTPAGAQTDEGLLRGVTRLDPFVLPLDKDSETCGITDGGVREVLAEAAKGAPFGLNGREYTLFVRLSSLPKQGDCFSSIDLGVYWEGGVALPGNPRKTRAKVKLWESGTIIISPRSAHWPEVTKILKHLVDNLIATWRADNRRSG